MSRADIVKNYLPEKFYSQEPFKSILEAEGEQSGELLNNIEDLLNQLFYQTATWGLDYWESELGIKRQMSQTTEQRREIIKAKLKGAGMCTLQKIIDIAKGFAGTKDVIVTEFYSEYRIEVKFEGGMPNNYLDMVAAIDEVKPAHILLNYEYPYNLVRRFFIDENWTVGQMAVYTVNEVLNDKTITPNMTMAKMENFTMEQLDQFLK